MISRYKKSICSLLDLLHEARENPFDNIKKWLDIQEILIKKIIYVENRIRADKKKIKEINYKRKNHKVRFSKDESNLFKNKIESLKDQIEDYNWIIQIYQSVGDGIAFTFIHKFDIKPQNFKQSAGFISQKKGLKKEKQFLRYAYENNCIAILNDITSVLRYSDIILITEDGIQAIEVKSSNYVNRRVARQTENANKLFDYLQNDLSVGLYQENLVMQRIESSSEDINYIKNLNTLIDSCQKKGIKSEIVEKGVLYLVSHNHFDKDELNSIILNSGLKKPFAFNLNSHKFTEQGYYPFSLSLNKSEFYWDFLIGKLNIMFFVELDVIEEIARKNGFKINLSKDSDFVLDFINVSNSFPIETFKMSHHYFNRTVMEFVSVKWLIQESFEQMNKLKETIDKKNPLE